MKLVSRESEEPPSRGDAIPTNFTHSVNIISPLGAGTVVPPAPISALPPIPSAPRFPISPRSKEFARAFFPDVSTVEWNDWRWQFRHRIRTMAELERIFVLSDEEREAISRHKGALPVGITPYYAGLMSRYDANEPLRRTHIPVGTEYVQTPGEADDPLSEDHDAAVPGLVHRYPDRVLFLVTGTCSTYCRYCTRSRMVGQPGGEYSFSKSQWERALQYIEAHTEIRDVLLSGGDPLTLADEPLEYLLKRLRAIKHIEFLRIGTKVPVVLPMRVSRNLTRVLKKLHPLWMSIHFTHPSELTREVSESTARLADAGIPLGSQTVLLKGINDDVDVMKSLYHGLLMRRVKPYYLYQCDPITGSSHFRTPIEKGLEIIEGLRGHTTGYAVPHYVVDAPGGGGKIPLVPDYLVGRDGEDVMLRNFEGNTYRYKDSAGNVGSDRQPKVRKGKA
ncbi:MAG: KamA family radical SAM protein [Hyphomicrobiaceae bacterium]|nr:KamA family radical SAM protein [Hyphomicrobiaceae bacterium]